MKIKPHLKIHFKILCGGCVKCGFRLLIYTIYTEYLIFNATLLLFKKTLKF